ncbi:MAG: metallophosphoesterase, partial [Myxococcales bacterium]|nr:metallophosphoesterase [Myxococcales bacterium]
MSRFRRQLIRNTLLVVVLSVGISETLILQWWFLFSGRPALGAVAFAGTLVLLLAANFLLLWGMRLLSRRFRQVRVLGHAYMLVTLGAIFTGPLLVAAFAAVGIPVWIAGGAEDGVGHRALVAAGGAAIAIGFASIVWGRSFGQRRVVIEKVTIPMPLLPQPLRGLRIAHLSDLHIGPHLRALRLRSFVDRVSAIDPDLIVITGDLFDFDADYIDEGCRELARLSARHGVFAILGN